MALYEDYLYDEFPVPDTHPSRVGAIASLFGMRPAPPTRCRVLELGCGLCGNIVPMAALLPESEFVGVDLSAPQIAVGQRNAEELGLGNLRLHAMSITDVDSSLGTFDYIICHGVYSWVPPAVQDRILQICEEQLAPEGIAYISFNTYPGWHMRGMLRDLLRREVGTEGDPAELVARARAFLKLLSYTPADGTNAQAWLRDELALLEQTSDKYLFYEYLVEDNRPVYFRDFAVDAAKHRLQYLADANFHTMLPDRYGPEAEALIARVSGGIVDTEHYLDLLGTRFFRRTLLCREELDLDRTLTWSRLEGLWIGSEHEPTSESPDVRSDEVSEEFRRSATSSLTTSAPLLKAALVTLAQHKPQALVFDELVARARALLDDAPPAPATLADRRALGAHLLTIFARGQVELGAWSPPITLDPGSLPQTTPLVRLQAQRSREGVTNLRHEGVAIDKFDRAMLKRMDGTRDLDAIVAGVIEDIQAGLLRVMVDDEPQEDPELIREIAEQKLLRHARLALLVG